MPVKYDSQKRATAKFNATHYDVLQVRVEKGQKKIIQDFAASKNESMNHFITRAIDECIEKDRSETLGKSLSEEIAKEHGLTSDDVKEAVAFGRAVDVIDKRIPGAERAILDDSFKDFVKSVENKYHKP